MPLSPLAACGLLLALLALGLDGKPHGAPAPPKAGLMLELEASSGPVAASASGVSGARGGKASPPSKGKASSSSSSSSSSRLMRDLRTEGKASRAAWGRMAHPEHHGGGGGGGGGGSSSRRFKGINKKGLAKGCFGLKLDRIGSMSGLGC